MKKLGFLAAALIILAACNKDQKAVNKLVGMWTVTNHIWTDVDSGSSSDDIVSGEYNWTFTFDDCKVKNGEGCTATWYSYENGSGIEQTVNYDSYSVTNDGTTLNLFSDVWEDQVWTITELSTSSLKIQRFNSSGEYQIDVYMEK